MKQAFSRTAALLGAQAMEKLQNARVAVFGLGGVGGYCLEALARSGVGSFDLIDADTIDVTNINRQILALHSTMGRKKTEVAKERILDINPEASVTALDVFAEEGKYDEIFSGADIIIDAIDSLGPKISLLESAYRSGIPVISSMGAALRRDPSLIRVADLYDSWGCPLARSVRSGLRKRGIGRGIDVVFSPEKVDFKYIPPEEDDEIEFDDKILRRGRQRVMLGSLPTVTAIFGETLAHLALTKLLPKDTLRGDAEWNPKT